MSLKVSVVVPTCNRTQLLLRCLNALLLQDFDEEFEIIVVDNAASEETRCAVEEWTSVILSGRLAQPSVEIPPCHTHPLGNGTQSQVAEIEMLELEESTPAIRYIQAAGTRGPAAARNTGWQAASGRIIAFTDDDCIPAPSWLRNGLKAFSNGAAGAYGQVIVPLPEHPSDYQRNATGLERSEFVTANCFYRREVLQAVGGFDERFSLPWREDTDLYFTVLERGFPLVRAASARVYHPIRTARWGVSIQQQKNAQYNALLYKKHPQLYRRKIQPRPPWHYYAMTTALVTAAAGLPWALALWVLMVFGFSAYRLKDTARTPQHVLEMALTSALIPLLAVFWRIRGAVKFKVLFL